MQTRVCENGGKHVSARSGDLAVPVGATAIVRTRRRRRSRSWTQSRSCHRGDARAGASRFARTCAHCHGAPHTGVGRVAPTAPVLPEGPIAAHADYGPRSIRLVFIEKIRHGSFRGYGGDMPPYAAERLTDQDVSDVLEGLGVLGL